MVFLDQHVAIIIIGKLDPSKTYVVVLSIERNNSILSNLSLVILGNEIIESIII